MDSSEIYPNVVERVIEELLKTSEATSARRDVVEAIKRKWLQGLEGTLSGRAVNSQDSNPSSANRAKYLQHLNPEKTISVVPDVITASECKPKAVNSDDEFEDEFADSEFVHATEVGRLLANTALSTTGPSGSRPAAAGMQSPPPAARKKREIINPEDLPDSLDDVEYDEIPEPSDCEIRIFGQTEVCESIPGPKRSESRWMVTVLNGFVKTGREGEELLFRTANQTMPHLYQFPQL